MPRFALATPHPESATVVAVAAPLAAASPALADYGPGAAYQVELSANASGAEGDGVWLWIGLNRDGTGDYTGSDCGHGEGAVAERSRRALECVRRARRDHRGHPRRARRIPAAVTVPATDGHYTGTIGSFITLPPFIPPGAGNSQLQVAP